jgi:hypothetical protein
MKHMIGTVILADEIMITLIHYYIACIVHGIKEKKKRFVRLRVQ